MNQPQPTLRAPVPVVGRLGIVAEEIGFAEAEASADLWDGLVQDAATPNPHFSHRVIAAHVRHGLCEAPRFLVLRQGRTWLGLLPFAEGWLGRGRRVPAAFTSPFTPNATPLLARGALPEAAEALVGALSASGRPLWRLPRLSADSDAGRALVQACARLGLAVAEVSSFERAVLERRASYDSYAAACLSANRRKNLRRQRARLQEFGTVEIRTAESGAALQEAIEAFLALEVEGWKGAGGSALASRPRRAAFAHEWFGDGPGPVRPRADLLTLGGRPVAISLALVCGGTAHLLKTTYDETFRACAPGLLLEDAIVRACHGGFAERLDSASLAGHVLEGLYPDRERIADLLIGAGGQSGETLAGIAAEERRRRKVLDRAKALVRRVRALLRPGSA